MKETAVPQLLDLVPSIVYDATPEKVEKIITELMAEKASKFRNAWRGLEQIKTVPKVIFEQLAITDTTQYSACLEKLSSSDITAASKMQGAFAIAQAVWQVKEGRTVEQQVKIAQQALVVIGCSLPKETMDLSSLPPQVGPVDVITKKKQAEEASPESKRGTGGGLDAAAVGGEHGCG